MVSRNTLDRWLRWYRVQGFEGLKPKPRGDVGAVRRHPKLFEEAAALRMEHPARSAAHIADILYARHGVRLSERTVREQLHKRGLDRAQLKADNRAFGRYEAARPNERWVGDVLVGPWVPHPRQAGSHQAGLFLDREAADRLGEVVRRRVLGDGAWCRGQPTREHVARYGAAPTSVRA